MARGLLFPAAAVDQGDVLGAQALGLDGGVHGGVAAADHHDAAPHRRRLAGEGLADALDVVGRRFPENAAEIYAVAKPSDLA